MSGSLFHIMSMGGESLNNSRVGVEVTGHNIANAHTPGFSRQQANVTTRDPQRLGQHVFGSGAQVRTISRAHDRYVEAQMRQEVQNTNEREAAARGLGRLEQLFSPELQSTVRDRFNQFFSSLRELANYPEEPSVRTGVVETAQNLTLSVQNTYNGVVQIQQDINDEMVSELSSLNQRLGELAQVNQQILETSTAHTAANDLLDRRDKLVKELASLVDLQAYEADYGMITLRGPGGVLLVEGSHSATVELTRGSEKSNPRLFVRDFSKLNATDVTDKISQGRVGGLIRVRDDYAEAVRQELNGLAKSFGEAFNGVHRKGFGGRDYESNQGRDFFEGLDSPDGEYAYHFALAANVVADPFAIAAAVTPGSPGDNAIATELIKLQYAPISDDGKSTVLAGYDKFVSRLGVDTQRARDDFEAAKIVHTQLESQRETVSGVSLDEEAANLLKYQQLFQASSRIITTADELMKTVLDMKR